MFSTRRYIILLTLILPAINLPAQNITGTWEGDLDGYEFLQVNVIQNGDKLCGYTWDYLYADQKDHCKAYFEGRYDRRQRKWILTGTSFFENSGNHILMVLNLKLKKDKGEEILEERPTLQSILKSLTQGFDSFDNTWPPQQQIVATGQNVYLKKVSDKPSRIMEKMQDCLDKTKPDTLTKVVVSEKPKDSLPSEVKITIPKKQADSLQEVVAAPVIKTTDSISIPAALNQRKNVEQSHITIDVKTVTLKVYDNGIIDGDTVSIFYNGRMLLSHQLLSEKPIEINLDLDENQTRHEIVLFAENLGSIPPNTALVVITAGDKRYELFASSSLQENAVLVFDYKPK